MELDIFMGHRATLPPPPPGRNPLHPEYRRESVYLVARNSMDVPRVTFARWLYDHEKINDGERRP